MQTISNFVKQHQGAIFAVSTSCLVGYLLLRNQIWGKSSKAKSSNLLDVSLNELIANHNSSKIKKIVITTSSSSKGEFRKTLINYLKSQLTEKNIKVLINCSPQKLLRAGCECFLESMESDDSEYLQYYYNALKAQYLIEDTISKIELINENGQNQIVMICDNNPFDIKLLNRTDKLWQQCLNKVGMSESDISDGYDLVIHVIEKDSVGSEDERIQEVWSGKEQYHQIRVQERDRRQNFQIALSKIMAFLTKAKEQSNIIA